MHGTLDAADALDTRRFWIAVRKLADSLGYGSDRSPFLGSGIEYVQSRPYQPGDPVRAIDWRVTARTGRFFVKEYEAPKRMPCYLLVDTSASMTVGSARPTKYASAVQVAGGLALACLERVSPVGVVGVGGRDLRVTPSLSPSRLMEWFHALRHFRYDEPTRLGEAVARLGPSLTARTLVVALSDFHDPTAVPALKLLAQRHDCAAIHFRDPSEAGVRGGGLLNAAEPETGERRVMRSSALAVDAEGVGRELSRAGVDHLLIETGTPFVARLRNFLKGRGLLGRGAR